MADLAQSRHDLMQLVDAAMTEATVGNAQDSFRAAREGVNEAIQAAVKRAVTDEREACAVACEGFAADFAGMRAPYENVSQAGLDCAALVRIRSELPWEDAVAPPPVGPFSDSPDTKVLCADCSWHGLLGAALRAVHPFEPRDHVNGCPECKSVDTLLIACDEPGCWKETSCGTPTESGYRRTCSDHALGR